MFRPFAIAAWLLVCCILTVRPAQAQSTCTLAGDANTHVDLTVQDLNWPRFADWCADLHGYVQTPTPPLPEDAAEQIGVSLSALGHFAQVKCQLAAPTQIVCLAQPATLVRDYDIQGSLPFALLKQDLQRRMFLRPGTILSDAPTDLRRQAQRLEEFLQDEGYFESHVEVSTTPARGAEPGHGVWVRVVPHAGPSYQLGQVLIDGAPDSERTAVAAVFHHSWFLWWGEERFRPTQFRDDLPKAIAVLRDHGYPAARVTGTFRPDKAADSIEITLQVDTGPQLQVEFVGNEAFSAADLHHEDSFKTVGAADAVQVETVRMALVRKYQRDGFYEADITADMRKDDAGKLHVLYTIKEGERAKIVAVKFAGNSTFDDKTLSQDAGMLILPSGVIIKQRWVDEWVIHDQHALTAYYQDHGFVDTQVTLQRRALTADTLEVTVRIHEGSHIVVGHVALHDYPQSADPNAALKHLSIKDGDAYVAAKADAGAQDLRAALASHGYLRAEVAPTVTQNAGEATVRYDVSSGPPSTLGGVIVRGSFRTRRSVIEQELGFDLDAPLNVVALGSARRRLRALNIFNALQLTPQAGWPDSEKTWILVSLEERDVRDLSAVLSFSSDDLFAVGADYRDLNLFGRALSLDVLARVSNAGELVSPKLRIGNMDRIEAKLRAPHPFGLPLDAEAAAFYRYEDLQLFRYRLLGGTAALIRPLLARNACSGCPGITGRLGYELSEAYFIDKTNGELGDSALAQDRLAHLSIPGVTIARIVPSIAIEARDVPMDPQNGYSADVRFELGYPYFAGPFHEDAAQFWRFIVGAQGYLTLGAPLRLRLDEDRHLGGPLVLAASAQYSAAGPWGEHGGVPLSETYAYGGDFSVRGLVSRASTLAIPDAHYMFIASVELRWYILQNVGIGHIQVAGFTDMGTVARNPHSLFGDTTVSVGPVIRYVTPVGPLSVAYGWPILRPASIAAADATSIPVNGRLHVTLGYNF